MKSNKNKRSLRIFYPTVLSPYNIFNPICQFLKNTILMGHIVPNNSDVVGLSINIETKKRERERD